MKKIFVVFIACFLSVFALSACVTSVMTASNDVDNLKEQAALKNMKEEILNDVVAEIEQDAIQSLAEDKASNADALPTTVLKHICDVKYGMWPQTKAVKRAVKLMSKATDMTGYYYSLYDGEHYEKVTSAIVYGDKYEFMDENVVYKGETYYFKVEPIKWRVLGEVDIISGEVQVIMVSDMILDSMQFCRRYQKDVFDNEYYNMDTDIQAYANNWAFSRVRQWLNRDFYNAAFTKEEKERIIPKNTSEICSIYDPEDPTENVTSLTYEQAVAWGKTKAVVSDYARSRNTFMSIYPDFYGNGRWWLCSPGNTSYRVAYASDYNLKASLDKDVISKEGESAGLVCMGVRPVISMKLTPELLAEIIVIEEN